MIEDLVRAGKPVPPGVQRMADWLDKMESEANTGIVVVAWCLDLCSCVALLMGLEVHECVTHLLETGSRFCGITAIRCC